MNRPLRASQMKAVFLCCVLLASPAYALDSPMESATDNAVAEIIHGDFEDTDAVQSAMFDRWDRMSENQIEDVVGTLLRRPFERGKPNYADAAYRLAEFTLSSERVDAYRANPDIRRNLVRCCLPNFLVMAIYHRPASPMSVRDAVKLLDDIESRVLPAGEEVDFSTPLLDDNARSALHTLVWLDDRAQLEELITHRSAAVGLAALQALTRLGSDNLLDLAMYHASRADVLSDFGRSRGCMILSEGFSVASLAWLIVADFLTDAEQNIYFSAIGDRDAADELLERSAKWGDVRPALVDQYRQRADPEDILNLTVVAEFRDEADLPGLLAAVEVSTQDDAWLTFSGYDHPDVLDAMWRWWEGAGRREPSDSERIAAFVATAQTMNSDQGVDQYRMVVQELLRRGVPELGFLVLAGHTGYGSQHEPSTEASRALLQLIDFLPPQYPLGQDEKRGLMIELLERAQRWSVQDLETRLQIFDEDFERVWFCEDLIDIAVSMDYPVTQADLPACWDLELELDSD